MPLEDCWLPKARRAGFHAGWSIPPNESLVIGFLSKSKRPMGMHHNIIPRRDHLANCLLWMVPRRCHMWLWSLKNLQYLDLPLSIPPQRVDGGNMATETAFFPSGHCAKPKEYKLPKKHPLPPIPPWQKDAGPSTDASPRYDLPRTLPVGTYLNHRFKNILLEQKLKNNEVAILFFSQTFKMLIFKNRMVRTAHIISV